MTSRSDDTPLTRRFYDEMRGIAARLFVRERRGHTLQPTAVVHEACLRLLRAEGFEETPRPERLAIAARVMKQVLVDHARAHGAGKRGGGWARVQLSPELAGRERSDIDLLALKDALDRLESLSPRQAEVATLRVYADLTLAEIAAAVGVSKRTVEGEWAVARAWLRRELDEVREDAESSEPDETRETAP